MPKKAGEQTQHVTAQPAQQVTAAPRPPAPHELGPKRIAVPLFVRFERAELLDQTGGGEASDEDLASIDVHSTVLARMIDFEHAVGEPGIVQWRG